MEYVALSLNPGNLEPANLLNMIIRKLRNENKSLSRLPFEKVQYFIDGECWIRRMIVNSLEIRVGLVLDFF